MNFGDREHLIQLISKTRGLIGSICCNTTQSGLDVTRKVILYCVNQLLNKYATRSPLENQSKSRAQLLVKERVPFWPRATIKTA